MGEVSVPSTRAFNRAAAGYDELRRRLVPCFDAFYGTALDLIDERWPQGRQVTVLDLGAGTGLLSYLVRERHPGARIRLLDASEGMLDQARLRFDGRADMEYFSADLATDALEGPWDIVISALAIHHLEHPAKRALFHRIRAALAPGGLFVNAEQVLGPSPATETRYARVWLDAVRKAGVSEAEIERTQERMSFDRCAPVEDQMLWMREAGFVDVDCSFKQWRFAVISGIA
jgi:tRNA (cmo5U34)-methyltransferase